MASKGKILVVDDSELVLDVVQMTLEEYGYEVITSDTPFNAFVAITRDKPDVVLLDLSMPGIEGDVLLDIIEESGVSHRALVLLHSSRSEQAMQEAVARSGADGYIRKTDDPDELVGAIESWVAKAAKS